MFRYKKRISVNELNKEFGAISKEIEKLKTSPGFIQFILYSISELFANINEHSQAKTAWVTIRINKRDSLIEIFDNGIGLRKSYFLKEIYPKNDFSAIEFALGGLSTKKGQERGFGLFTIRKAISSLAGEMIIESGEGLANVKEKETRFSLKPKKKGVKILLKTPIKSINFYKYVE